MTIRLIVIGKTFQDFVKLGSAEYIKRLKKFIKFEYIELPEVKNSKNLTVDQLKNKEADLLNKYLNSGYNILLDEKGKYYSSIEFANLIENLMNQGIKYLNFYIGGAYGFCDNLRTKYKTLSLSPMTFSHQLVRVVFLEQLYRAFTIINSLPYHH